MPSHHHAVCSITFGNYFNVILILTILCEIYILSRAVQRCSELVPVPDPLPVGVIKPVS